MGNRLIVTLALSLIIGGVLVVLSGGSPKDGYSLIVGGLSIFVVLAIIGSVQHGK